MGRAVVGEGADTREAVRQAGHRGGQHEGQGQDEAEGPHLTVSGFGAALPAVLLAA